MMHGRDSEDKNHLAMLAIPVMLSMLVGFSGDLMAIERIGEEAVLTTERIEQENRGENSPLGFAVHTNEDETKDDVRKKELLSTVDEGNYERFLTLTKGTPFAEIMTESAFYELREQYNHSRDGFVTSPYTG